MSAILGTLFILGGRAKLLLLFCRFACRRRSPGGTNPGTAPRTFLDCTKHVHSARFLNPPPPEAPNPRFPRRAPHFLYALSYKEAAPDKNRGAAREKGVLGPLHGPPSRAPRAVPGRTAALPAQRLSRGPSGPLPEPRPSDLAVHGNGVGGMMSASSPLLDSSFLASFWARAGLNVTFTMARPGAPSRAAAAGLRRGLRALAAVKASSAGLRAQLSGGGGGRQLRGGRGGDCGTSPAASQLGGEGGRRLAPAGAGRSGWAGSGAGPEARWAGSRSLN